MSSSHPSQAEQTAPAWASPAKEAAEPPIGVPAQRQPSPCPLARPPRNGAPPRPCVSKGCAHGMTAWAASSHAPLRPSLAPRVPRGVAFPVDDGRSGEGRAQVGLTPPWVGAVPWVFDCLSFLAPSPLWMVRWRCEWRSPSVGWRQWPPSHRRRVRGGWTSRSEDPRWDSRQGAPTRVCADAPPGHWTRGARAGAHRLWSRGVHHLHRLLERFKISRGNSWCQVSALFTDLDDQRSPQKGSRGG